MSYKLLGEAAWDSKHPLHSEWLEHQQAFGQKHKKPAPAPADALQLSIWAKPSGHKHPLAKDCLYWPMGKCRDGDSCRFTHDPAKANSLAKDCLYWSTGTCRDGDSCRFTHDPAKVQKPRAAPPMGRWR